MKKEICKENWCLYPGDYPDLHWSRLRVYNDNSADVLQADGGRYKFDNEEEARLFLFEDDYTSFDSLDEEDEEEIGVSISSIKVPFGDTDDEIITKMRVSASKLG